MPMLTSTTLEVDYSLGIWNALELLDRLLKSKKSHNHYTNTRMHISRDVIARAVLGELLLLFQSCNFSCMQHSITRLYIEFGIIISTRIQMHEPSIIDLVFNSTFLT